MELNNQHTYTNAIIIRSSRQQSAAMICDLSSRKKTTACMKCIHGGFNELSECCCCCCFRSFLFLFVVVVAHKHNNLTFSLAFGSHNSFLIVCTFLRARVHKHVCVCVVSEYATNGQPIHTSTHTKTCLPSALFSFCFSRFFYFFWNFTCSTCCSVLLFQFACHCVDVRFVSLADRRFLPRAILRLNWPK